MNRTLRLAAGAATLLSLGACAGLDVDNPNNPDVTRALASGEDVKNIAISTMNSWYLTSTFIEPYLMLSVTGDMHSANFGNFGMRFNNLEPRARYENNSAGGDRTVAESPWNNNYGTLGAANDVIRALSGPNPVQIANGTENDKWKAIAVFAQAASLANLALIFDSAFVVDETFDATAGPPSLELYPAVSAAAMGKWDALIASLAGEAEDYAAPVVLPTTTFTMNSANLLRMANTMAALTLRLTPRTNTELTAKTGAYWTSILNYANAGISGSGLTSFDVTVQGDNNNWFSFIAFYGAENTWMRVDYRLINRMDAQGAGTPVPARFSGPADIRAPGNPGSNDQRLADGASTRDYRFRNNVIGDPGRGIWMQSAYSHDRYIGHARTSATSARTPVPYILAAENDLLIAEALIMTGGDRGRAATLINNTRVTRGGLAAITAGNSNAEFLAAIDYERDVELLSTNGFGHFYARSAPTSTPLGGPTTGGGRLQPGTVRHLPIPAKELETLAKSVYTYGGVGNPDMIVLGQNGAVHRLSKPARIPRPAEMFFRPY
jgi:hypothetical protein